MRPPRSGFDKLARPYRWMEYLTFGPFLMRTRLAFLSEMQTAENALLLGDGDGRFCAYLLEANREIMVDAVDSSPAMLQVLIKKAGGKNAAERLRTHLQAVSDELPQGPFDLVCTHFLLDCLEQDEVVHLARAVQKRMPSGQWVISEFAIPQDRARWPATFLVSALYFAFGLLTGLRVRRLPRYDLALREAGFTCVAVRTRLFGILRSELWAFIESSQPAK